MKRDSNNEAVKKPVEIRRIHVVTAVVFLLSLITLAFASDRLVSGSIGYSWLALGASLTPLCWSIGLLAVRRVPRSLGRLSLALSIGVVILGSRDSWPALVSIF